MQELEKILEEIEKQKSCCLMIGYAKEYNQGALKMAEVIEDIIRKHMDNNNLCEKCSRRKWYQIGYKDGKNDGWIPVEERDHLPEAGEHVLVSIGTGFNPEKAFLSEDGHWTMLHAPEGYNDITGMVDAWRPLPEPYSPERSNNHDREGSNIKN